MRGLLPMVVLIGSHARGNVTGRSDLDIVTVNTTHAKIYLPRKNYSNTLNLISFTKEDFLQRFKKGDLFLYHILKEGRLLYGDQAQWDKLRVKFKVKRTFKREISRNRKVIDFLLSDKDNTLAPVAFLSIAFRALKQTAIFKLAEAGHYEFKKAAAIKAAFPWITKIQLEAMLAAEFIAARNGDRGKTSEIGQLERRAYDLFHTLILNRRII